MEVVKLELDWQNLKADSAGASGKTFDSAMGEWITIFQGSDCELVTTQMIIVDETKAITPSYRNGRILFYEIDDQRTWEGHWIDEIDGGCAEKYGSTYWGVLTIQFNESYTEWKGNMDECGKGRKYTWDGFR